MGKVCTYSNATKRKTFALRSSQSFGDRIKRQRYTIPELILSDKVGDKIVLFGFGMNT